MRNNLPYRLFLGTPGLLLGVALAVAVATATPAWSEQRTAGEDVAGPAVEYAPAMKAAAEEDIRPVAADAPPPSVDVEGKAPKGNTGFPQLNPAWYPSQIFWLFVTFTLMYLLMSRMALPRVGEVLETRREQKDGNLRRAEQLQDEAAKVRDAYEAALSKAHESAQEALGAAEQEIAEKLAAESARFAELSRKRIATAEQGIEKAKEEALSSLADISADISAEIVAKIAGVQVTKADAKKAVTQVMKKEAA